MRGDIVRAKVFYSLIGGWRVKLQYQDGDYRWIGERYPNWRAAYDSALSEMRIRIAANPCWCNWPHFTCPPCRCWELVKCDERMFGWDELK